MTREQALAGVAVGLLKILGATLRVHLERILQEDVSRLPPRCIFTFWHNRILAVSMVFLRFYPKGRGGVTVLTSPSRDGEILARIMAGLKMGAVRGSSSRRGATALRELQRVLAEGRDVAITPDGPRGPRYVLGPGVVHLAQTTGTPIFPIHIRFGKAWRMRTWDGFAIPWPFSKIQAKLGSPLQIPAGLSDLEFEEFRGRLEKEMRDEAD